MSKNNRASIILIRDGKILLMKEEHNEEIFFAFPGGSVEVGETIEDALRREAREELSIDILKFKKLFTHVNPVKDKEYHHFLVSEFTGEPKLGPGEFKLMKLDNSWELKWVDLDRVAKLSEFHPEPARESLIKLLKEKEL